MASLPACLCCSPPPVHKENFPFMCHIYYTLLWHCKLHKDNNRTVTLTAARLASAQYLPWELQAASINPLQSCPIRSCPITCVCNAAFLLMFTHISDKLTVTVIFCCVPGCFFRGILLNTDTENYRMW